MRYIRISITSTLIALLMIFAVILSRGAMSAHAASDEPQIPDTPAGQRLAAFLKAFNTGDENTMRDFHLNNEAPSVLNQMKVEEFLVQDHRIFSESGGFELRRVLDSSDNHISALLQAKNGEWTRLDLKVEPDSPHKIIGIRLEQAEPPSEPSAGSGANVKMTEAEIVKSLADYINDLAKADKFSGVVLIARDGKPLFERAWGLADKSKNIPNRVDTKFNLGSMNKMFTAVAIAQLVERGKLSFDDTVGKYLPDYPNKTVAEKVTVHQLLTHTSGLGSYWNEKFDKQRTTIKSVSDYLALFADEPPAFEPGARFQYSNSGFIVLGAIIEKVSGQNYYDYTRDHIFKPAGMLNTGYYQMTEQTPNLAMGYTTGDDENPSSSGVRTENTTTRPNRGGPAGGGYSTAEDLLKFHQALRDHKLLSARYTDIVTTGKVDMGGAGARYAYGFGDMTVNGKRVFGHNGGAPGIAADLSMFPDLGYTTVVLSNYDPPAMMPVARKIRDLLTRQ